ncbi:hypothetical protein BDZ45DRAFT_722677 [Acephala macrosclerotiorum]|nr:hypothetical protein BDZ45DRAFT_722677 [Acephala macrosclerotiorum]
MTCSQPQTCHAYILGRTLSAKLPRACICTSDIPTIYVDRRKLVIQRRVECGWHLKPRRPFGQGNKRLTGPHVRCGLRTLVMGSVDLTININGDEDFVSEVFLVKICDGQGDGASSPYFHSLDLLLSVLPTLANGAVAEERLKIPNASGTNLETLVRCTYGACRGLTNKTEVAAKVILAPRDGYLCRSDILDVRMRHSEFFDKVISFPTCDKSTLLPLLLSSPAALLSKQQSLQHDILKLLQNDLEMRLSFDWILPTKPIARTLAVVAGRPMYSSKQDMYDSRGYFQAAKALGISMIVLDEPGHWLEGQEFAYLREDFIAVDISNVVELPQKIANAVRGRNIDGIVTFSDAYVTAAAEAAEILGLPTEPAQVLLQTHLKDKMRKLVNQTNIQVVRLDTAQQLDDPVLAETFKALQYPLIVKPCRGAKSKGAVHMLDKDGEDLAEHGILFEMYVDGPEPDANFVLWDGKVLFLEVCDNFPCQGDASGATLANNFAETVLISNSRLPPKEVEIIQSSLHRSLLQLGFSSGVFHVEAQMQNSSMQYQDTGDGTMDLVVRSIGGSATTTPGSQPDAFLIEVNARTPGTGGTWVTLFTYGVDMGTFVPIS